MNKFGKLISFALVTTMVLGSSITAFASQQENYSIGQGKTEGHINLPVMEVELPTVAEKTFDYIMDPERLISQTGHAKYPHTIWPNGTDDDPDTGVYFYQGKEDDDVDSFYKYGSTSAKKTVTNKSRSAIDITVKAERVSDSLTDIDLVTETDLKNATKASLYIGLECKEKDGTPKAPQAILNNKAAQVDILVDGSPDNYVADVVNGAYVYRQKKLSEWATGDNAGQDQDAYDASWKSLDFNLIGAVTEGFPVDNTQTAPEIKITWSWDDAANRHSVTFDTNGGSNIETQRVLPGGKANRPLNNPTKDADAEYNYGFAGWFDATGENEFDFGSEINEDTIILAKWNQLEYITDNISVTIGYGNTNSLVLRNFAAGSTVGLVTVNGNEISSEYLLLSDKGNLIISDAGFDFDTTTEYTVRAIIGGVGYTATTNQQ